MNRVIEIVSIKRITIILVGIGVLVLVMFDAQAAAASNLVAQRAAACETVAWTVSSEAYPGRYDAKVEYCKALALLTLAAFDTQRE